MRQTAHHQRGMTLAVILLSVLASLLTVAGAGGAYLYFSGGLGNEAEAAADAAKAEEKKAAPTAKYLPLEENFVVNFLHEGRIRFLQVTLETMAYEDEALKGIKAHLPVVRDRTLMLLSQQTYETLTTSAGKEVLRAELRDTFNDILAERVSDEHRVEDVYFTSFVIQ